MMSARHFLSLMDCTPEELVSVIRRGVELKDLRNRGVLFEPLKPTQPGLGPPSRIAKGRNASVQMARCCQEIVFKSAIAPI